jgi:hypothetical protein
MLKGKARSSKVIDLDSKQIEELLKNHEGRINKLEIILASLNGNTHIQSVKEKSVKEFILEKQPKGTYQIGIAIAYYLEKFLKMSSFTIEDLEQGFRDAKEPLPQNLSDLIYKNAKKGLFMESKEQKNDIKSWVLTSSGERLVENNFEKTKTK